ncbi:MAG TPA: polyprenyl synthetase family protein [Thermoanaerobaculia bacterium]|nr:polyprenyl synthetase family protein [Thermoanaerobaculia bacterium]
MNHKIRQLLLGHPEVAGWPQMVRLIDRALRQEIRPIWDYPVVACEAAGGTADAALPAAAAIFCSVGSIHLVDDLLDDDPDGDYRDLGAGPTANLALALQGLAHRLLETAAVTPETRTLLQESLAHMMLATAFGQNLDVQGSRDEEGYWRVVQAKSPPLFGTALALGGLVGGAPPMTVEQLESLGRCLGLFTQVSDDLVDALEAPASADWQRRFNNLPILYALTAQHPEREAFESLSSRVSDPAALAAAQRILVGCGAVSYCAFRLVEIAKQARQAFARIALRDPAPLARLVDLHLTPLERLLASTGVEVPPEAFLD